MTLDLRLIVLELFMIFSGSNSCRFKVPLGTIIHDILKNPIGVISNWFRLSCTAIEQIISGCAQVFSRKKRTN